MLCRFDQELRRFDQVLCRFDQELRRFDQVLVRFDLGLRRFDLGQNRFDDFIRPRVRTSNMVMDPQSHASRSVETVVSTIDHGRSGDAYVIADISTDDAWLRMDAESAPTLTAWR